MYQTVKVTGTLPKPHITTGKVTPGPYKATKLWNQIVCLFREGIPLKRHRRRLKVHQNCFSVKDAADFLQELLKSNHNIGNEATRMQSIRLLEKFLCFRVIEDVNSKLKGEELHDENRLFRLADPEDFTFSGPFNKSLAEINNDIIADENVKYAKYKTVKELRSKSRIAMYASRKRSEFVSYSGSSFSFHHDSSIPACVEVKRELTEFEIKETWKNHLVACLQNTLQVDRLDDMLPSQIVNGEWIKCNTSNIGKSGIVQVSVDEDLPQWVLTAMNCLANWPNGVNLGPPSYPGFENDILQLICQHYCNTGITGSTSMDQTCNPSNTSIPNYSRGLLPDSFVEEPLLTYDLYELFTNAIDLLNPEETEKGIEALQLCLLLLPPRNRRKLHLLLRMLAKMSINPHLEKMGSPLSTRSFLLQTFSPHILSCCEEVPLDELLAIRLVTFMLDNHKKVMEIPESYTKAVEGNLTRMRKPFLRYDEGDDDGSFLRTPNLLLPRSTKKYQKRTNLRRSKSFDVMKSVAAGWRQSSSKDDNENFTKDKALLDPLDFGESPRKSRIFEPKRKRKQEKKSVRLSPAKSCPNVVAVVSEAPQVVVSEAPQVVTQAEDTSSKGMWTLMRKFKKRSKANQKNSSS